MCRYKGFPSNVNTNKLGKTDYNGRLAHNVFIDTYYTTSVIPLYMVASDYSCKTHNLDIDISSSN